MVHWINTMPKARNGLISHQLSTGNILVITQLKEIKILLSKLLEIVFVLVFN